MRLTATTLLWSSSILSGVLTQNSDKQVTAAWEENGTCAYFFKKFGKWSSLAQTCVKYCENHGGHGYSECDLSPYKDIDFENGFDKSIISTDEAGDVYVPSRCKCENKDVEAFAGAIFDIVAKGLAQLDNILCAAMLESFKTIIDVGINFVPGGAALNGAKAAVQGAKSFAENGLEAADFFGNWVGKACGVPDWNFDLWGSLLGAPDSYGTSIGCKKKNKSGCKKPDSKPDPTNKPDSPPVSTKSDKSDPTSTKEEPKPTSTNDTGPKTTSTKKDDSSTTTSSSDSCPSATDTKSTAACQKASPCEFQGPYTAEDDGEENTDEADTGEENNLLGRDGHRSPRRVMLEKVKKTKTPKPPEDKDRKVGNPCTTTSEGNPDAEIEKFKLRSDKYPGNRLLAANVDSYGWTKQNDKCDYAWQSGGPKNGKPSTYDSEHVMEWQVVTDFFAKMNEKGGTKYSHPDPAKVNEKVNFCTYWIKSWSGFEAGQEFSIDSSTKLTPWAHIAAAYPSKDNYKQEFVRLQRTINAPAKANLFSDRIEMIFNKEKMDKWSLDKENRDKALLNLRLALGTQKYLNEPDIIKIFKDQKTRMGDILDKLDTAMTTHPRKIIDDVTGKTTTTYNAWEKQNLLTEWNAHMDGKWRQATQRQKNVMDTYIKKLDDAHCKTKDDKDGKNGKDNDNGKDNKDNGKDDKNGKGGKDNKDDDDPDKVFCDRLATLKDAYRKTSALSKAPWDDAKDGKDGKSP